MDGPSKTLADDMLVGADAIAEFMFGASDQRRRIYHLAERRGGGRPPFFRLGNSLCARRSTLVRWMDEQERAA